MPPETIDLSLIIVNWNTRDLLRDCLSSARSGFGELAGELIVIDNASSDGSARMITEEFPDVRLIANNDNRGFAAANNQGLRVSRGRYVLLLNPDTVVLDDVLSRTVEWADGHADAGVVGCQVLESATTVQRTCFRFPSPLNTLMWVSGLSGRFPRSRLAGRAAYGPWVRHECREVDVVSGMFMLVRREALDQVGLMDEGYFVFTDETDWCRRFRDAGWRCVFAPVGRILHVDGGSKSTDQVSVRMYVEMQKGILRFHRKHLGLAGWAMAKALFAGSMAARAVWWRLFATHPHKTKLALAATRFHWRGVEP